MVDTYRLPEGNYDPTFLKALACAIHDNKLKPMELEYWWSNLWTQREIAVELWKRFKPK